VHASRRARELVRQILAFSRKSDVEHAPLDLRALVVDGLRLLRASIPSTIELREHVLTTPLIVAGDESQLSQILLNLGSNAEYALRSESDARLDVELTQVTVDAEQARPLALSAGDHASLVVRDSGGGIPADVLGMVFEPFFTTKPVGEGTGMGLAVVQGIVEAHGGSVRVESTSEGTAFEILLSVSAEPAKVASPQRRARAGGSGRLRAPAHHR
jgi:signal transduction histidine kinase